MTEDLKKSPEVDQTVNTYGLPIPEDTKVHSLLFDSPGHSGPLRGAVDIAVDVGTAILAPLDGRVVFVRDDNDQQGVTPEFAKFNNFIEIQHSNSEYSRYSHISKDSSLVKVGDRVTKGQPIAKSGFVGYATLPHLHWIVFKVTTEKPGFVGLRIKLERPLEDLVKS